METIMSDRDSDHMLLELQEARAEIDRLRKHVAELVDELTCCATQLFELRSAVRKLIGPVPGGE